MKTCLKLPPKWRYSFFMLFHCTFFCWGGQVRIQQQIPMLLSNNPSSAVRWAVSSQKSTFPVFFFPHLGEIWLSTLLFCLKSWAILQEDSTTFFVVFGRYHRRYHPESWSGNTEKHGNLMSSEWSPFCWNKINGRAEGPPGNPCIFIYYRPLITCIQYIDTYVNKRICMCTTFIPIFIPAVDNDTVIPATISHWRTIIGDVHMSHEKTLVIRCIEGMKSYPVI